MEGFQETLRHQHATLAASADIRAAQKQVSAEALRLIIRSWSSWPKG
jgi:hypothetical protein